MTIYRGMEVPNHLCGVLPYMGLVEETREALLILSQQWDLLDVLSRVVQTRTEVDKTRAEFRVLSSALIAALGDESLNKLAASLSARAQVTVDIIVRNLFERTADIGFLATDDDLRRFLRGGAGPSQAAVHERLLEYRKKYSVYENVVVMEKDGLIRAQAGSGDLPQFCRDSAVGRSLKTGDAYVETFAPSDLSPDGHPALTYTYRIVESNAPGAAASGVLSLVFRFTDELDGIFRKLLAPEDWTILALLDEQGVVLACSDTEQLPVGKRLSIDETKAYELIRHAGRRYIAVARTTKGYQGYQGLGWRGCALIPVEVAFEEDGEAQVVLADRHYRAISRNAHLFSESVRDIPNRADAVQAELNRTVWNGKLAMPRIIDADDPAAGDATARRTLLSEISGAGSRTQQAFASAVGALNRTATGSLVANCAFSAALAVDLMDRNLYERANDCRWWALTTRFREILSQASRSESERMEITAILVHINGLYSVYTNLILFDRHGTITAVSNEGQRALVDTMLPERLVQRFTNRADTAFYGVSDFEISALYDDRATYIYGAPILDPADPAVVVGGIAIVFDSEPQFRAMLDDAGLTDASGRVMPGSRNLFVDHRCRIIASTAVEDVPGTQLILPTTLLEEASGRTSAQVLAIGGDLFAVGVSASVGYREYKGLGDTYRNRVYAVSLLRLGAEEAEAAVPVPVSAANDSSVVCYDTVRRELATFTLGGTRFAFDRQDVIEAIVPEHVVPAPGMPPSVVGYTTHRGKGIIVLDASRHLGVPTPSTTAGLRPIIIFRSGTRVIGLEVHTLNDVLEVDAQRISQPGFADDRPVVKGVVKPSAGAAGDMLLLLDAEALTQARLTPSSDSATHPASVWPAG